MRLPATLPLALALLASGCGWVSFGRRMSDDELRLRSEVKSYYGQVARAFAAGNPDALASLFDPSIARPMSHAEVKTWAQGFFAKNGRAGFRVESLEIESIGPAEAVVLLRYRVETPDGKGDFAGTERDTLSRRKGRWYIAAWEKLP